MSCQLDTGPLARPLACARGGDIFVRHHCRRKTEEFHRNPREFRHTSEMSAISPWRVSLWLAVIGVPGVAGWTAGRWAHSGIAPSNRATHPAAVQHPLPATREPKVEPGSPAGKWMARVKAAAPGDFAALLEELDVTLPKTTAWQSRDAAQKWLLGLWISQDADAAVAYVADKKDEFLGSSLGLVLGSVAPDKVAAVLSGPHKADFGQYFPSAVLCALAGTNPGAFLKLDPKIAGGASSQHWPRAIAAMAAADPVAAAEAWTSRGGKASGAKQALFSVVWEWQQRDPAAARQWVEGLADDTSSHLARHAWLGAMARKDPRGAMKELAGIDAGDFLPGKGRGSSYPPEFNPSDARVEIAAALARESLPEALAAAEEMAKTIKAPPKKEGAGDAFSTNDNPLAAMHQGIVKAGASSLPDVPALLIGALKELAARSSHPGDSPSGAMQLQEDFFQEKMSGWNTGTTLEAIRLLVTDAGASGTSHQTVLALVKKAAAADPGAAVAFLSTLPESQRAELARDVFNNVTDENAALLKTVAQQMPADHWTGPMGQRMAGEPLEFATTVAALPDTPQAGLARNAFASQWAKKDPNAAAQWIATLPQASSSTEAARGLADSWARFDDTAASAWAASLPTGHARDGAALGLAAAVAATEPEAAWQWAASISNPTLSADAFWNVARHWGNEAPVDFRAAFSAALDRGGYTGDIKAMALRDLEKPPASNQQPKTP